MLVIEAISQSISEIQYVHQQYSDRCLQVLLHPQKPANPFMSYTPLLLLCDSSRPVSAHSFIATINPNTDATPVVNPSHHLLYDYCSAQSRPLGDTYGATSFPLTLRSITLHRHQHCLLFFLFCTPWTSASFLLSRHLHSLLLIQEPGTLLLPSQPLLCILSLLR